MKSYIRVIVCIVLIGCLSGCFNNTEKIEQEPVLSSYADLRDTLRNTVKDSAKLDRMLAIVDQELIKLKSQIAELKELRREDVLLNANYNASRDDFERIGNRIHSVHEQFYSGLIKTRMAIAQLATDDEWKKITSRDLVIRNL